MNTSAGVIMLVAVLPLLAMSIAWHFLPVAEPPGAMGGEERIWHHRRRSYRNVFRGPYFWTSSKGQTVYRVTVEVRGGVRTGWVRCGGWWLGLLSDQAEVRWDNEPAVVTKWDESPAGAINPMHDQWIDG